MNYFVIYPCLSPFTEIIIEPPHSHSAHLFFCHHIGAELCTYKLLKEKC